MASEISAINGKYRIPLTGAASPFGVAVAGIDGSRLKVFSIDLPAQDGVKWIANYEIREGNTPKDLIADYTLQIDQALIADGKTLVIRYINKGAGTTETANIAAPDTVQKSLADKKIKYKKSSTTDSGVTYQVVEVSLPWGDPAVGII